MSISPSGLRTATAQVETPRIITPSSTAWPPTGASRTARSGCCSSGAGVALRAGWLMHPCYRRVLAPLQVLRRAGGGQDVVHLVGFPDPVARIDGRADEAPAGRAGDRHRPGPPPRARPAPAAR